MIVVRIKCGLGNQLFQYAAARALARRLDAPLHCDIRWFDNANRKRSRRDRRDYLLPLFGWDLPRADRAVVESYYPKWWRRWTGMRPRGTLLQQAGGPTLLNEFQRATGDVCLDGYWQGESFFAPVREEVAAHLLRQQPGAAAAPWVAAVQAPGAAAVHVRRGDYVHSASPRALLGPLDVGYYRRALHLLGAERAVVFSDDLAWCRENFDVGLPRTFVELPATAAGTRDELLCLGLAHRVVIANSSFSWWGAWIATQRGARVVGPAPWFTDRRYAAWEELFKVPGWHWL